MADGVSPCDVTDAYWKALAALPAELLNRFKETPTTQGDDQ